MSYPSFSSISPSFALGWLTLPPMLLWLLNRGIRHGLRAPRLPRQEKPDGLSWRAVAIAGQNGKTLRAWYIPGGRRALLLMHGWGGNAATLLPLAMHLHQAGYSLLLPDARCHGDSDDDSFASLPRFAEDVESCLGWLAKQAEVDPEAIGLVGPRSVPAQPCWSPAGVATSGSCSVFPHLPIRRQ